MNSEDGHRGEEGKDIIHELESEEQMEHMLPSREVKGLPEEEFEGSIGVQYAPFIQEEAGPSWVFAFAVPAKGGYYYLAIDASSREEARTIAAGVTGNLPNIIQSPILVREIENIGKVLKIFTDPGFKARFREHGYAYHYVKSRLFLERLGRGEVGREGALE